MYPGGHLRRHRQGCPGRASRTWISTKILVFYPKDGVSDIQQLQMATQEGANVGVSRRGRQL